MASIRLNANQEALLANLDTFLDMGFSDGIFNATEDPLTPPVPKMTGYSDLENASRQTIRETFRLLLGIHRYAEDKLDLDGEITDRSGSPGDTEINARKGRFALDPGSSEITIVNDQVSSNSVVVIVPEDDQSPMAAGGYWYVIPGNGAFRFSYDGSGYTGVHRFVVH
jgi:hypothetical protein